MSLARCKNGHIYDREIYGENCPYCDSRSATISFVEGAPRQIDFCGQDKIDRTEPAWGPAAGDPGKTTAPPHGQGGQPQQEETGKTAPILFWNEGSGRKRIVPVVGWLVCVKGRERGRDYTLRAQMNRIGRGSGMDVCIRGDDTISSDTHAKIDYDRLNTAYYLLPGNNSNTIYCNGAPVYSPQKLNAFDRIVFGRTELLFMPFCSETFSWPSEEE